MKLAHPKLAGQLMLNNEKPCVWVIESPEDFLSYTQELYRQCDGEEGRFVLSEEEKEKEISKYAEIIFNPFAVNINDRKVMNRLYFGAVRISGGGRAVYEDTGDKKQSADLFSGTRARQFLYFRDGCRTGYNGNF